MKVLASTLAFVLISTVSTAPLEARNAAAVNAGTVSLIERLEGFRADYYYIGGDKTIGMESSQLLRTVPCIIFQLSRPPSLGPFGRFLHSSLLLLDTASTHDILSIP